MISSGSVTAQVGATVLDVTDLVLTLDDSWSRYAQCDLTIVTPASTGPLDPRLAPLVTITLSQQFGPVKPVSNLTTLWAGKAVSALTTAWKTKLVSAMSAAYGSGAWTGAYREPGLVSAELHVRRWTINLDGTTTLHLETHDAFLEDLRSMHGANWLYTSDTLRGLIIEVFHELETMTGRTFTLATGWEDMAVMPYPTLKPGQTYQEFFTPYLQQGGLRLWCDLDGVFRLTLADVAIAGSITLDGSQTVTGADDTIDRDHDLWADGVAVIYNEAATGNVSMYPTDGRPVSKVLSVTVDALAPFNQFSTWDQVEAAAKNIWTRLQNRGREATTDAVNDYSARPGMGATIQLPGQPTRSGIIRAVTWKTAGNTMTTTTRNLE